MAQIPYSKGGDDFKPWPESTYDVMIKNAEAKTSKQEKPQLELSLECAEGPNAGKNMKSWFSLVPAATFRIDQLLDACGVVRVDTGDKDQEGKPILTFDSDDLRGKFFRFDMKHREYQGKIQGDLQNLQPSPLGVPGQTTGGGGEAAAPRRPRPAAQG